jgi:hypothetical protein
LALRATKGLPLIDADGFAIDGPIEPGTDFYLRPKPGTSNAVVTATVRDHLPGRVLTGVAQDEASHRFTPVALAIPTEMAIEFDISWDARKP